jgi:hypothetical protein
MKVNTIKGGIFLPNTTHSRLFLLNFVIYQYLSKLLNWALPLDWEMFVDNDQSILRS